MAHSEETKMKMKNAWTPERKEKHRKRHLGCKRSAETCKNISKAKTGNSPAFWKGKQFPEEMKRKMSESAKGRPGPVISEEGKKRIPEAVKKSWERPGRKEEHRQAHLGENHPNWKGRDGYGVDWTDELKEQYRERDGRRCANPECSRSSKKIDLHHINEDKTDHSPNNIVLVCGSCHRFLHLKRIRVSRKDNIVLFSKSKRTKWPTFYKH